MSAPMQQTPSVELLFLGTRTDTVIGHLPTGVRAKWLRVLEGKYSILSSDWWYEHIHGKSFAYLGGQTARYNARSILPRDTDSPIVVYEMEGDFVPTRRPKLDIVGLSLLPQIIDDIQCLIPVMIVLPSTIGLYQSPHELGERDPNDNHHESRLPVGAIHADILNTAHHQRIPASIRHNYRDTPLGGGVTPARQRILGPMKREAHRWGRHTLEVLAYGGNHQVMEFMDGGLARMQFVPVLSVFFGEAVAYNTVEIAGCKGFEESDARLSKLAAAESIYKAVVRAWEIKNEYAYTYEHVLIYSNSREAVTRLGSLPNIDPNHFGRISEEISPRFIEILRNIAVFLGNNISSLTFEFRFQSENQHRSMKFFVIDEIRKAFVPVPGNPTLIPTVFPPHATPWSTQ